MYQIFTKTILFFALLGPVTLASAQPAAVGQNYRNYQELQANLKNLQSRNPGIVALHQIAMSPGNRNVTVIEIGKNLTDGPAIFVGANFEGISPLATEGALYLAQFLLDSARYRTNTKWYILPLGNPDAAQNYFGKPRIFSTLNALSVNIDVDDQTDEDGYEDLNLDGYITMMRLLAPDGDYRLSDEDPRLLVRADRVKGERGLYKLYSEGIDNDGDGLFNEDEPGGVNPGINFPHDFQHFNKEAGLYPGFAPETYGVMKFIYDHPEIVMTITFGESNFLTELPQEGRTDFDPQRIRIPDRMARQMGLSASQTYTMEQLKQAMASRSPDIEITDNMIISQLSTGPERSFRKNDIVFYEALSKEYKAALKAKNIPSSLMPPEKPRSGSFELWSYFHLGVPSIALSLWEPEVKKDTTTAVATPATTARPGAAPEKKPTPEKQLLDYFDQARIKGFTEWTSFKHPQLGEVEIGGFLPFAKNTPPADQIGKLLEGHIPFVASLAMNIPEISITDEKITPLGAGIYRLEIFVENKGTIPYPTDMGQRNQQPAPVVLILEGNDIRFLEGLARTPIHQIAGNQVRKFSWVVQTGRNKDVKARLESPVIRTQMKTFSVGN